MAIGEVGLCTMVPPGQWNGLGMRGALAHALPVAGMMDLSRGAAAFTRIREHYDAAKAATR